MSHWSFDFGTTQEITLGPRQKERITTLTVPVAATLASLAATSLKRLPTSAKCPRQHRPSVSEDWKLPETGKEEPGAETDRLKRPAFPAKQEGTAP